MNDSLRAARPGKRYRALLIAFCVLAALKFVVRGPVRAANNSGDLRAIYLASRAWTLGSDPYDPQAVKTMWAAAGGPDAAKPVPPLEIRALYPPTTYALMSPIARMPWRAAKTLWCAINVVTLFVFAFLLARLAAIRWSEPRGLCLIAAMLALEPSSTAVMLGQPSIVVAALAAASLLWVCRGREGAGGLLEGLALALKPQVAIGVAAAYLFGRRWRACLGAAIAIAVVAWIAIARFGFDLGWLRNYRSDMHFAFGPGGPDDFTSTNQNIVELINLQYPLTILLGDVSTAIYLAGAIALMLAISPAAALLRRGANAGLLHCASLLLLVELIASYHRGYDAVVIGFPIAWSLSPPVHWRRAWPVWIGAAMFMLPSGIGIRALGQMRWFPQAIASGIVWNGFVVAYQAWAVLLIALWMTYCLMRYPSDHAARPRAVEASSA